MILARFGPGAKVLIVGGDGVADAIAEAGLIGVWSADDGPLAVLQGYGFELTWQQLNEAAIAIHRGAHWVATNTDPTRPTERGLVPGNGAAVAAVAMAVPATPEVAGKPFRPLLDDTVARIGCQRPIFVGDRLDTDVAGARNAGLDSLLVLSGSHGPEDLLRAAPGDRPTHIGHDLRALLDPPMIITPSAAGFACGSAHAAVEGGRLIVETKSEATDLEALWAAAHAAWAASDQGIALDLDASASRAAFRVR
jgi:ribonucleotide monophosphatase NagD (HAD superfamily)